MKKIILIILCTLLIGIPTGVHAAELNDYTVQANGTSDVKINLFDYWLKEGSDAVDPEGRENFGINQNHLLLFHFLTQELINGTNRIIKEFGRWNAWEEKEQWLPVTGMVEPVLDENGYPVLSIPEEEILATNWLNTRKNESLEYLFNPEIEIPYRKAYKNVKGLFQRSANKGDYYSSYENFAEYNQEKNQFLLYNKPAINGVRASGQFFPFNKGEEVFDIEETSNQLVAKNINSNNEILNHYLGMTLEAKFTQPEKGQAQNEETKQEQDMIFTFTGDDDIWIYIDNILVADLGGIHNALTAEINFATGKITIKPSDNTAISSTTTKEYFLGDIYNKITAKYTEQYMKENFIKETDEKGTTTKYTFKDNTSHTLKIFYLERGNTDSNLEASFWPSIKGEISTEEDTPTTPQEPIKEETNPETNDILIITICAIIISMIGFLAIARFYKYKIKNNW